MVVGPSLQAIEALRSASLEERISALKQLKNDIVGHELRKELAIKQGILEPLVDILKTAADKNGGGSGLGLLANWTPEDEERLQATLIIASLANGGTAFLAPMVAAGVPEVLMAALRMHTATPKLITAILQALKSVANSWTNVSELPELQLYSIENNGAFVKILTQPSPASSTGRQQLCLVADIIALTASTASSKASLVQCDVLDTLAGLLASYAVSHRHVELHGSSVHPLPPPAEVAVPKILSAISTIISDSNYLTHRFIFAPCIRELFSGRTHSGGPGDHRQSFGPRHGFLDPTGEPLLPPLHIPSYTTTSYDQGRSRAFPAQAALQSYRRSRTSISGIGEFEVQQTGDFDHFNALCGWLLHLARSMHGHDRLMALKLLALVNNAIDVDYIVSGQRSECTQKAREREKQLAVLAVPLAVKLVQTAESKTSEVIKNSSKEQEVTLIKEQACEVLALLIRSSRELQIAAVEASAIKYVCLALKKTFDNVPLTRPMWSSTKTANTATTNVSETCKMGSRGIPPEILHVMRCRQGALTAVAEIGSKEDSHRKALVDAGVVPCIIDSLTPFAPDFFVKLSSSQGSVCAADGNTKGVVIAACLAAKTISRSVALLRTSLIDAGIAKPVSALLAHSDADVQLAATDVVANLVLDFSPMRETLLEDGIVKTLTAHAKTNSRALRRSSMWALKHLVMNAKREVKINALEELGIGWLVATIQGEQDRQNGSSSNGGVSIGVSGSNAAGEQVDLLNPAAATNMDIDEDGYRRSEDDGDFHERDAEKQDGDGEVLYDEASSTHYQASQLRSTLNQSASSTANSKKYLAFIREMEQNSALQAKRDEIAVQEQALDFIRNLLNGEDDCAFMFEHLIQQIGSAKIFDLLTTKLLPLPYSARSGGRPVYNPVEIIYCTVSILTHLANGLPKHKQLIIAQKPLLQAWLPHFTHVDPKVRVMSIWAVSSLTWVEDEYDRKNARQRATELRTIGIENAVRNLQHDPDLDVRERVRTALKQIDGLL